MLSIIRIRSLVGGILLVPLLLVSSYYFYWYFRAWQGEKLIMDIGASDQNDLKTPPVELADDFDPSINAGIYRISDFDKTTSQVSLVYDWPQSKRTQEIRPLITCEGLSSKIFDLGAKSPRYVSISTMLEVIQNTPQSQLMLSGLCDNNKCSEINRECTLTIIQEKYVAN